MSDLNTILQGAWRYVDKNRGKWNDADGSAWWQAFRLLKREMNSSSSFGRKCDEETIAPLKQIILGMPKSLEQSAEGTPMFADITRMSSECRQYIALILFYVFSWAATAAPFKGTSMLDTMSCLENLLLACWVKESSFRHTFRRSTYSSKKVQASPASLSSDKLWTMFRQWRANINVIVVPNVKEVIPDNEKTILEESIEVTELDTASTSSGSITSTPSVFTHVGRPRTSSIASSFSSLDAILLTPLRKVSLNDEHAPLDMAPIVVSAAASTTGSDTPTRRSSTFTAPSMPSRSSSFASTASSIGEVLGTPPPKAMQGSILPIQRYSWEKDRSLEADEQNMARELGFVGDQFSGIPLSRCPASTILSGEELSAILKDFSESPTTVAPSCI